MSVPVVTDDGGIECHECGGTYENVGYHWSRGSCDYPSLSDRDESLIVGLLLGGASLRTHTSNPFVEMYSANSSLLEWLNSELGWLSTGVSMYREAAKSASLSIERGLDADPSEYSDVYVLRTRSVPSLDLYESWYDGELSIPTYLVLTPETARVWYACAGSMNWDSRYPGARPHASLSAAGTVAESQRLISESTLDADPTVSNGVVRFDVDETEHFLDWIGESPSGVEYKWCTSSFDEYQQLADE